MRTHRPATKLRRTNALKHALRGINEIRKAIAALESAERSIRQAGCATDRVKALRISLAEISVTLPRHEIH